MKRETTVESLVQSGLGAPPILIMFFPLMVKIFPILGQVTVIIVLLVAGFIGLQEVVEFLQLLGQSSLLFITTTTIFFF